MRGLFMSLLFMLASTTLGAEGSAGENAVEDAGQASDARTPADSNASEAAPAPVEETNPDDSFVPTDQLRHDQEVDYPTDI